MDIEFKSKLARLAYDKSMSEIQVRLTNYFDIEPQHVDFVYVPRTDTEGFVFRYKQVCYIVFSGTDSCRDLYQDLFPKMKDYKFGGQVISGHQQIFDLIAKQLNDVVNKIFTGTQPTKFVILGHSLGGNIAFGAADILLRSKYKGMAKEIMTWGPMNGWNDEAIKKFNERHNFCVNYINKFDFISKLYNRKSGRPGRDYFLKGKWGHALRKYIHNIKLIT